MGGATGSSLGSHELSCRTYLLIEEIAGQSFGVDKDEVQALLNQCAVIIHLTNQHKLLQPLPQACTS